MSKWMFMNANDMMTCNVQMNIRTNVQKTISTALHLLKNDKNLFAVYFSASPFIFRYKPPLGASSPFTFGGISVYFSL
jgi:hypothetical protein